VLNHLAHDRLLTLGKNYANESVVDVSHEALLTRWPTLSARLEQDRAAELARRNFDGLAAQWSEQIQQGIAARLLRDSELQEIEDWLASDAAKRVGHSAALEEWVAQSGLAAAQDKQQQHAVLERMKVQEQALRFSRRMLQVLLAGLALVGLFFLGRLGYFEWLRQLADREAEMVAIPAGPAVIGFAAGIDATRDLVAYRLDRYEVPNRHYRAWVDVGVCSEPLPEYGRTRYRDAQFDNRPVVDITVLQAKQYCDWRGRRLPTVIEWERAVRGTAGRRAPWTTVPAAGTVQIGIDEYFPDDSIDVNASPMSATPQNEGAIFHLYGNIDEIVVQDKDATQYFVVGRSFMSSLNKDLTEITPIDADSSDRRWGFRCGADS
jgi:formylglycine-generating enzyme required for sulfatase activity